MDYNAGRAFERIEQELIDSMMRNMKRHRVEEMDSGREWAQWQAAQLQELQKYKQRNKRYDRQFKGINRNIKNALIKAKATGEMKEEIAILEALQKGFVTPKRPKNISGSFFRVNERKMNSLLNAVNHDMKKAERAVLRFANDQYRKVIFNAQVYANSGAATYEKAVDMATKDFLRRGINCIQYKNGAQVNIAAYADMAIRTAAKRAYLHGEGGKRAEWGIHTVIMNRRSNACPLCLPFEGKVLIDDVWSGGHAGDGPYSLMSSAMSAGLYHPNCKDVHTTYFPGISEKPNDKFTKQSLTDIKKRQKLENLANYADRQQKKQERLSQFSLDPDNQEEAQRKKERWEQVSKDAKDKLAQHEKDAGLLQQLSPYEAFMKKLDVDIKPEIVNAYEKANGDRKKLAEILMKGTGANVEVEVKKTNGPRGYNNFSGFGKNKKASVVEFCLQKDDPRSLDYQMKTAFHELYHTRLSGLEVPVTRTGKFTVEEWKNVEETMTELAAHYQMAMVSDRKLMPAYSEYLSVNLPRLKKLPEFSDCHSFTDFGEKAMRYRFDETKKTADWREMYKKIDDVKFDFTSYVKDNYIEDLKSKRAEVLEMIYQNAPDYRETSADVGKIYDNFVASTEKGFKCFELSKYFGELAITALYRLVGVK